MSPIITFLSDFGTADGYTGSVKGVIKTMAPQAEIIDISHSIAAHDVAAGAWSLLNYYKRYPHGTIHLAVVDPGVGSERLPLILQTQSYFFVGPDNGLFSFIARREKYLAYSIKNQQGQSATFHARDIFAPAAALLALGLPLEEIAEQVNDWKESKELLYSVRGGRVHVKAIAVDRFGNIVCGFHKDDLKLLNKTRISEVHCKQFRTSQINNYYAEKEQGAMLALWGSQDYLEIAINRGSAAQVLSFDRQKDKIMLRVD